MPRVRRRGHKLRGELTSEQTMALLIGPTGGEFASDDERKRAYWEHREELTALVPRGWGWVEYEAGGFLPEEGGRMTAALKRLERNQQ